MSNPVLLSFWPTDFYGWFQLVFAVVLLAFAIWRALRGWGE